MGPTHNMPEELRRQISVVANGQLDKETDRQTDTCMIANVKQLCFVQTSYVLSKYPMT